MEKLDINMGTIDRVVRITLAIIAAFLGWFVSPWFYAITVIFGATSIIGFCPLYKIFGISTDRSTKLSSA